MTEEIEDPIINEAFDKVNVFLEGSRSYEDHLMMIQLGLGALLDVVRSMKGDDYAIGVLEVLRVNVLSGDALVDVIQGKVH